VADSKGKGRKNILAESRKKGLVAGSTAVATGVAAATVGLVPLTIAGMGATGFFTYRWIKHRARNGIRF
tara:strand:+ start:73 stop:279 length:207 start_codon:yes stop_codon:yes gene_type:complete